MRLNIVLGRLPFLWRYARYFEPRFPGSQRYWEERYASAGTSGHGSYGQLAAFKAEVLNEFVAEHQITSVIEFGCGDGNQLSLARYPKYLGLDVSRTAISRCVNKFKDDVSKSFILYDGDYFEDRAKFLTADMSMSLDVIYHLVEDKIFAKYMHHLFGAGNRYVCVYASNYDKIIPNSHERHRNFSKYVADNFGNWKLVRKIDNRFPSSECGSSSGSNADFYFYAKV